MMTTIRLFLLLSLLTFSLARADVMNLNEFMPTRLEDASVLPKSTWQLQGTVRGTEEDERLNYRPSVRWGALENLQLEFFQEIFSGTKDSENGSGETQVGAQWYLNDEKGWIPSLAFAPQFSFPTGKSLDGIDPSVKLFLSRTLSGSSKEPITQMHFNYQYEHNSSRRKEEDKINKLIVFGLAHKLSDSASLLADFVHEKGIMGESSNELELGCLYTLSRSWMLGPGIALELQDGYASWSLAIQKTF